MSDHNPTFPTSRVDQPSFSLGSAGPLSKAAMVPVYVAEESSHTASLTDPIARQRSVDESKHRVDRIPHRVPVEEVVARHTAIKPSSALCKAYTMQSIRTATPLLLIDLTIAAAALIGASWIIGAIEGSGLNPGMWRQLPALLLLQTVMMSLHQLYPAAGAGPVVELRGIARSSFFALLCLSAMNLLLGQLPKTEFVSLSLTAVLTTATLPVARSMVRRRLASTSWWGIRLLLLGSDDRSRDVLSELQKRRWTGFRPVGIAPCQTALAQSTNRRIDRLDEIDSTVALATRCRAPAVAFTDSLQDSDPFDRMAFQFPLVVSFSIADGNPRAVDTRCLPQVLETRLNMPFLRVVPRLCKRSIDLAICIPGLLILAIPMGMIALLIKWVSPGPAIYGSRRVGQHGKVFSMWKFRSMIPNADRILQQRLADDPELKRQWESDSKLKSDPRIIPGIGHLLRKWSLDELPQLWNVLKGEMSLVGPRPVPPYEIVRYQRYYYEYTQMWPGMTGLWQVSGRNDTTFETRVFLVHHYARNWSPWMDLWLLLHTPAAVLSRSGAY